LNPQESYITIVVDAMGGDFAPAHEVRGAADALAERPGRFSVVLVGQQDRVDAELRKLEAERHTFPREHLLIVHAPEVISMEDGPTAALRTKKQSSIAVGLELQKNGKAQAFVSAGNTGAVLSASTLILGRVEGVGRPTIGALVPTVKSPCFLVDAGANVDCKPRHLFEFGVMGTIYMSALANVSSPRVGLLNVGEEESKGNEAVQESYRLLKESRLNFVGNVEGRDVLKGEVDVIVCDGFAGNILLKFGESIPAFFKSKFTAFAARGIKNKFIALIARNGLRGVMKELDYQEHGGVPLLGVNGVTIIGHGRSTPKAIKNMIFRAEEMVRKDVNGQIKKALEQYHG
jgi:glycerol-3-phosphate acyltransferase PlsX